MSRSTDRFLFRVMMFVLFYFGFAGFLLFFLVTS